MISRRHFLGYSTALGLSSLEPRSASAQLKRRFTLAQLQHKGSWNIRPTALKRLAWMLDSRTSLDPNVDPIELSLQNSSLFKYPFLCLTGEGKLPPFEKEEIRRLQLFLSAGGFLWIDNAEARPGGDFDTSVRTELSRVLPDSKWARVPKTHTLFKSFYIVDRPVGRVSSSSTVEAIEQDGRLMAVLTQNDLLGAYCRNSDGLWTYEAIPGGERQRDRAFRFGINIVIYALCLGYKSDSVHVDYLLRRRDWRGDE